MVEETPSSLVPVTTASWLAERVNTNPESVYDMIRKAEDWVKELKETARQSIIKRMVDDKTLELAGDGYVVSCKKQSGNIRPEAIRVLFITLGLDHKIIVYPVTVYEVLPNAKITLQMMIDQKVITQAQYDVCFDKPKHVVSVKAKSMKSIDGNTYEEG